MNCDKCKHYCWYYDKCSKWDCEVDAREEHQCFESTELKDTIMDEYRETILKAIREYEKQFDPVEQFEITYAIGVLYEIIRAIETG